MNFHSTNIKVSVIVPVYNVEPYIRKCLDSLVNQTLQKIEIILINDCSTDGSGAICDEYASADSRIQVIHNAINIRQGLSRNKGIEISRGEYVGFVDPDDWVDLDFYEKLYAYGVEQHADIAKGGMYKYGIKGKLTLQSQLNSRIKNGIKRGTPNFLLFSYEHCTAIYRRNFLGSNKIDYPDLRNGEDDVFLLKAAYYSNKIVLITNTYYYYRQHLKSTIANKNISYFESTTKARQMSLDFLADAKVEQQHYEQYFRKTFWIINRDYTELKQYSNLIGFRKEYIRLAFEALNRHKYEPEYLLILFKYGSYVRRILLRLNKFRLFKSESNGK
jgi:glycosyltransferase involved in cell wall biosynthesis